MIRVKTGPVSNYCEDSGMKGDTLQLRDIYLLMTDEPMINIIDIAVLMH